jgi:hypothetical protein
MSSDIAYIIGWFICPNSYPIIELISIDKSPKRVYTLSECHNIQVFFVATNSAKSGTETPISFKEVDVYDATPIEIDVVKKNGKVTIRIGLLKRRS